MVCPLFSAKLHKLVKGYLDLERLRPDAESATEPSLIADVTRFQRASLAGDYYQSFEVNWRNSTEQSTESSACRLTEIAADGWSNSLMLSRNVAYSMPVRRHGQA